MTTVITRLYADEDAARAALQRLRWEGLPARALEVIGAGTLAPDALAARMTRAGVHATAVPAYAGRVRDGNALLVVRATYRPLGAARITREALARTRTIELPGVIDDHYVVDPPDRAPSILKDHPRFLSLDDLLPGEYRGRLISTELGIPLLSRGHRHRARSVMPRSKPMSATFWPMPLLSRHRKVSSAMPGGRFMSRAFWPMPLVIRKVRTRSVIRGGALPFSRAIGMPTISRRPADE